LLTSAGDFDIRSSMTANSHGECLNRTRTRDFMFASVPLVLTFASEPATETL
jgi:hypothetical protein